MPETQFLTQRTQWHSPHKKQLSCVEGQDGKSDWLAALPGVGLRGLDSVGSICFGRVGRVGGGSYSPVVICFLCCSVSMIMYKAGREH